MRGRVYAVEEGSDLYPTSGTSEDYAFSRHFTSAHGLKMTTFTIETATEFQPPYSEALNVISEVSSGIIQFLLHCVCVVREAARGMVAERRLEDLRQFRDEELLQTRIGQRWYGMLSHHTGELIDLMMADRELAGEVGALLDSVTEVIASRHSERQEAFSDELIERVARLMEIGSEKGSRHLRHDLEEMRSDLRHFAGRNVRDGLMRSERSHREDDDSGD